MTTTSPALEKTLKYNYGSDDGLATLANDGQVPETRMRDAIHVQNFVQRLYNQDALRSWTRGQVRGLVDGNPPFKPSRQKAAGRAGATNCNYGTGRTYLESAQGAFYDLTTESPGMIAIETSHGATPEEKLEYNRIMSAEADETLKNDPEWEYDMQRSQQEMVLHGCGPMLFEDTFKILPRSINCGDLKVPERTPATTTRWEVCTVDVDYYPPQLFAFIENEGAAAVVGWDVEYTKKVIANAMAVKSPGNRQYNWEWYQQEIKNNSLTYINDSKICRLAYVFWKEFDGSVTEAIVERLSTGPTETKYLFFHRGRYENFNQCIHPMYQDRGNGGMHHAVTGLGVKMFGVMETENRLLCKLTDDVFAPKIIFKPTTAEASQKIQLNSFGSWGLLTAGADAVQNPIQGFIADGLAMFRATSDLMRSNLSSYRQQVPSKQEGNPPTARQVSLDASQASALGKTTINRYYKQLDMLYTEIVRRMCNLNSTDQRAKDFQKRCMEQGVPEECFGRIKAVYAVRIVGQGSAFLRREAVTGIAGIAQSLPEEGRQHWMDDYIGAMCGQSSVRRYNPQQSPSKLRDNQDERAMTQIGMMKIGLPPVITSDQNALRFAGAFLSAAVQSAQSLQQGANPAEVLAFLNLAVPSTIAHLQRIQNDPIRGPAVAMMMQQVKQLSKITDGLKKQLGQMQAAQKAQQEKTQAAMSDQAIAAQKAAADIQLKQQKQAVNLTLKQQAAKMNAALADARTASELQRANAEHSQQMRHAEQSAAQDAAQENSSK